MDGTLTASASYPELALSQKVIAREGRLLYDDVSAADSSTSGAVGSTVTSKIIDTLFDVSAADSSTSGAVGSTVTNTTVTNTSGAVGSTVHNYRHVV